MDTNMKWNDYKSDTLYLWSKEEETLFIISEGTGENLLDEDIAEGYVDYWMTDSYDKERFCEEGGQWLEKKMIYDIDYTIQGVIDRMMTCDLWMADWEVIDEETGEELRDLFHEHWYAKNKEYADKKLDEIFKKLNKKED